MDAAVGHQRHLVVNALSDRQPVQRVTKYGSDVLVESSASATATTAAVSFSLTVILFHGQST